MDDLQQEWYKYIPIVIMAAFGGLVRVLTSNHQVKLRVVLIEITIAIFAGLLICLLIPDGLGRQLKYAAASMAGYCARGVLYIFSEKFMDRINKGQ